jgi:hypothetical protein
MYLPMYARVPEKGCQRGGDDGLANPRLVGVSHTGVEERTIRESDGGTDVGTEAQVQTWSS